MSARWHLCSLALLLCGLLLPAAASSKVYREGQRVQMTASSCALDYRVSFVLPRVAAGQVQLEYVRGQETWRLQGANGGGVEIGDVGDNYTKPKLPGSAAAALRAWASEPVTVGGRQTHYQTVSSGRGRGGNLWRARRAPGLSTQILVLNPRLRSRDATLGWPAWCGYSPPVAIVGWPGALRMAKSMRLARS